jgi:hypothetical protein
VKERRNYIGVYKKEERGKHTQVKPIFVRKESLHENISVVKKNGIRSCVNIQQEKDLWQAAERKYFK